MNHTFKMKFWYTSILIVLLFGLAACGTSQGDQSGENEDGNNNLEDYPENSIDAIVGFESGGGQDVMMRTMGEVLNDEGIMEESFVVDNMPGAGGLLAAKEVAKRKDDSELLIVMPEYGAGWDPRADVEYEDFSPVASIATSDIYIVVNADSPYETIDDLFNALKEDEDMTISTLGPVDGGEAFKWDEISNEVGIDSLNFVPMEGAVDSFKAVLSNQVDVTFGVLPVIKDYVKEGEVKPLAILSEERSEELPDVPTLEESGYDFSYSRFTGIWTGADVSEEVIGYWEDSLEEMTETDAWNEFLEKRGLSPYYKNTEDYTELLEEEGNKFQEYVEQLEE